MRIRGFAVAVAVIAVVGQGDAWSKKVKARPAAPKPRNALRASDHKLANVAPKGDTAAEKELQDAIDHVLAGKLFQRARTAVPVF